VEYKYLRGGGWSLADTLCLQGHCTGLCHLMSLAICEKRVDSKVWQKNLFWVADLTKTEIGPDMKWRPIMTDFEAAYQWSVLFISMQIMF
jgi:hypothetical protein